MSAKHTPGPWYARGEQVHAQRDHVCGGVNQESVFSLHREPAERRANARLIAAAPELVDALRDVICLHSCGLHGPIPDHWNETTRQVLTSARALLDRIEGKP